MKNSFLIISICLTFWSCFSENKRDAASKVGNLWKSENTEIGAYMYKDTEGKSTSGIELTLINLTAIDKNYDHKKVTSASALSLFVNLNPDEYNFDASINISVNNFGDVYEQDYTIESLIVVNESLTIIDSFFILS